MVESCGMSMVKYLLFAFNIIFCISGIILIVFGSIILAAALDTIAITGEDVTYVPSIILIVAGIVIFVIAFLGCYGAIRESYGMLMTFAIFLLIIFIVELAIGVAVAVNKDKLKAEDFKSSFTRDLVKDPAKWDNIQKGFKCCGAEGHTDWGGSIPDSCCSNEATNGEEESPICVQKGKNMNYLYPVGCFEKISMNFENGKKILIGIGIGIAFVEIVGIVLACWLAAVVKREQGEAKD